MIMLDNINLRKGLSKARIVLITTVIFSSSILVMFLTDDMSIISSVVTGTILVVFLFTFLWMFFEAGQKNLGKEQKKELKALTENFSEIEFPGGFEFWMSKKLPSSFSPKTSIEAKIASEVSINAKDISKASEKRIKRILEQNKKFFSEDSCLSILLEKRKIAFSVQFLEQPDKEQLTKAIIASKNVFDGITNA